MPYDRYFVRYDLTNDLEGLAHNLFPKDFMMNIQQIQLQLGFWHIIGSSFYRYKNIVTSIEKF